MADRGWRWLLASGECQTLQAIRRATRAGMKPAARSRSAANEMRFLGRPLGYHGVTTVLLHVLFEPSEVASQPCGRKIQVVPSLRRGRTKPMMPLVRIGARSTACPLAVVLPA